MESEKMIKPNLSKLLLKYLWPYRFRWLAAFLCMILQPLASAGRLYLIKLLIDDVLRPRNVGLLPWIVAAYLGLSILKGIASYFDDYLSTWIGGKAAYELRSDLYFQLERLDLTFHDHARVGDLVTRVVSDTSQIQTLLVSGISDILTYILSLGFVVGMLFYLDWGLASMALITAPVIFVAALYYVQRIRMASRHVRTELGNVAAIAEENLSNIQAIKAFDREEFEKERFELQGRAVFQASVEAVKLRASFGPIIDLLATIGTVVAVWFGAHESLSGHLSIGSLVAFLGYLGSIYTPLRGLARRSDVIQTASASAERIFETFNLGSSALETAGGLIPAQISGRVYFDQVKFSYDGKRDVLNGLSLEIKPGETVALVGESGVGKTTVASLLLRFYQPKQGRVLVDGMDLREMDLSALRNMIAIVPQEPLLFTGSIRENIRYGRLDATDEEVEQAARLAYADGFIGQLPNGYDTVVGRKGATLSGGQRQRIAIARAFLKNAPILILDEATAALDALSETAVQTALKSLLKGRTVLIITHSFSSLQFADRIAVIDRGILAGIGKHEELLITCLSYRKLLTQTGESSATDLPKEVKKQ